MNPPDKEIIEFGLVSDMLWIRLKETYLLWRPVWQRLTANRRMYMHGLDPYRPKFYGHNPLTGLPVTVVFDEPAPGCTSILQWNPLLRSWMYSENAGLKWERIDFSEGVMIADCLTDKPEYSENIQ